MFRCPVAASCGGEKLDVNHTEPFQCPVGYGGPLCATCAAGWSGGTKEKCYECHGYSSLQNPIAILVIMVGIVFSRFTAKLTKSMEDSLSVDAPDPGEDLVDAARGTPCPSLHTKH